MLATEIISVLAQDLPAEKVTALESADGMPTIGVEADILVQTAYALRDNPALKFAFLADVVAVDYYPREPRFEVLYLLVCPGVSGYGDTPKRLRLRVKVPGSATLPSLSSVWQSANWGEREAYDFFGLQFDGHPDLRRILMPEDWEGYPMRKDYPVQINQPVKTYEPLQVTEEEFVQNVEEARKRASSASARK
jgi:NADH-quinone oxidoreductase subunit C